MKALIAIAFTLFVAAGAQAQITAANFIEKIACKSGSCIDEFLKTKKYSLLTAVGQQADSSFFYNGFEPGDEAFTNLTFELNATDNKLFIMMQNPVTFDKLLKGFADFGYTPAPTSVEGGSYIEYTSAQYPKYQLVSGVDTTGDSASYTLMLMFTK